MTEDYERWLSRRGRDVAALATPGSLRERLKFVSALLAAAPARATGPLLLWRDAQGNVASCAVRGTAVVGRGADCHVVGDSPEFSRRHFRIRIGDEGASVEDLASTNGTRVNGRRIDRTPLADGDVIEAGGRIFVWANAAE